jgi:hypothetical protein
VQPKRRRSFRGSVAAAVLVGAVALLAPASASAASVTIGKVNPDPNGNGNGCDPGKVYTQQAAQIPFVVPSAGVITAWSTKANGNAGQQAALKTLRQIGTPPGAFTYSIVGSSALESLSPGVTNRFGTRIPVQAGDKLGYFFPSGAEDSQVCRYTDGGGSDDTRGGPSSGLTGSSFTSTDDDSSTTKYMNLEAVVETDADGDGFGDDTQDRCRGASGPNGGCPAGTAPTNPGGGGADTTKPALGRLSFARSSFAAASSGSAFTSQRKRKRKPPVGSKFSFNLSEASAVKFTIERKTTGRRVNRRCKTRTKKNKTKPRCTLYKKVSGSFTVPGKSGKNTITFRGRVGGRKLRTGSYRMTGTATDSAKNASTPARATFRIVK